MMPLLLLVGGLAAAGAMLGKGGGRRSGNSAREDDVESAGGGNMGKAAVLTELLGAPYYWGGHETDGADKDDSVTSWEEAVALLRAGATGWGLDCSLFANLALVKLRLWPSFRRKTAATLAADSNPVKWGEQRPGDLAYYPGHVMVVLTHPDDHGDSEVIGASGGGSGTFGNDPNARVKRFASAKYRSDFVTFMRPKDAAW